MHIAVSAGNQVSPAPAAGSPEQQMKGQEMFCHYRHAVSATKRQDKMCLWSTAGTPKHSGQASPDTRKSGTVYVALFWRLNDVFMAFLYPHCALRGVFLTSFWRSWLRRSRRRGTLAMYTSPRRKGAPSGSRSSLRADDSLLNPPFAIAAAPGGLANVSRPHSKQCARSPLSGGFCAGNGLSERFR